MSRGREDQLLVSKMIISLVNRHPRHLCTAWIDFKKAFENLTHTWIVTVIEMYQIQAGLFLCNFAVMRLENLHHFLNLSNNVRFNAIWHGQNVAALVLCWRLAERDISVMPSVMCRD